MVAVAAASGFTFCAHAVDIAGSYQLNPAHDGQMKFTKPFIGPLTRKWITDLGGYPSYPVYGDGRVFVTVYKNDQTYLDALNAKSGAVLWEVSTPNTLQPAYDNGRVYVVDRYGLVQAYNAEDGSTAWSIQQENAQSFYFDPPVAVGGGLYFVGTGSGVTLYGLDGTSGIRRWEARGPAGESVPAVTGTTVFVTYPCIDYAYDVATGNLKWSYQLECDGGGGGTPVVFNNRVYINDTADNVVLDATTGKHVSNIIGYEFPPAYRTTAGGDSMGIVVDRKSHLHGFDSVTGDKMWVNKHHSFVTPALVINGAVVIGDSDGNLYGLNPSTGEANWSQRLGLLISAGFQGVAGMSAGANKLFVPHMTALSAWGPAKD